MHISDHFVVVYMIFKDLVIFVEVDHHDKAYRAVDGLIERLIENVEALHPAKDGAFQMMNLLSS